MPFEPIEAFTIDCLHSFHYFEFAKDFVFPGEKHDFWEFVYVDKGELEITADLRGFALKQGDIVFHKPNEFHSIWANRTIGPNAIVMTFACRSEAMKHFEHKIFRLDDAERNTLAALVREALLTFAPPLDDPYCNELIRRPDAPFASEQLVTLYLQLFLIQLIRNNTATVQEKRLSSVARERTEEEVASRVVAYLERHVERTVTLRQVAEHVNLSKNHLNKLFARLRGTSIIHHYRSLKIERAKLLIREGRHTIAEIAERLSYSSPGNFSRHFKAMTDMYPTDYAKSVMSRL